LFILNLVPITLAFAFAALVMLLAALMLRRRMNAAADSVAGARRFLDEQAAMLPIVLSTSRADLAERHAGIEQHLWTAKRLDSQIAAATAALAERRRGLDEIRDRMENSRVGVERMKSALRMIMKAIELRRTILG
jgi:chromosome segregation ATPase